jgi:hypothetical protein
MQIRPSALLTVSMMENAAGLPGRVVRFARRAIGG